LFDPDVVGINIAIPDHTPLSLRGGGLTILPKRERSWGAFASSGRQDAVAECHPSATVIIPPRATSVANETTATQRARHLAMIDERMARQHRTDYNRRILVETAMFRYKTIIGRSLQARTLLNQQTEAKIGCATRWPGSACRPPPRSTDARTGTGDATADCDSPPK
jgi:hypothetical protein